MFIYVDAARIKGLLEKLAVLQLNGELETTMGCTV
jgi:UDP-N-acetylglucosamine pyrophosphorylase